MDEELKKAIIDLLNRSDGITELTILLQTQGLTLAAYITPHQRHVMENRFYSECEACMQSFQDAEAFGRAARAGIEVVWPKR